MFFSDAQPTSRAQLSANSFTSVHILPSEDKKSLYASLSIVPNYPAVLPKYQPKSYKKEND